MCHRELSDSHRMHKIDVNAFVSVSLRIILGLTASRWVPMYSQMQSPIPQTQDIVPEAREGWLKNPSTRTYYVKSTKLILGLAKQAIQVRPRTYISLLKDRLWSLPGAVFIDKLLSFWPQSKVANDHIGAIMEQHASEFKIDTCTLVRQKSKVKNKTDHSPPRSQLPFSLSLIETLWQ